MNKKFLSCDWGTSSFRLRLIDAATGGIISQLVAGQGMAHTHSQWKEAAHEENNRLDFYLDVVKKYSNQLIHEAGVDAEDIPIIISGMASSSIGMLELDYTAMPFALTGEDLHLEEIKKSTTFLHDIILISGAKTATDVMRGEETQLIGCSNGNEKGRQAFIFPGTHSKHIITEDGKAVSLTTFMTGEFFDLLSKKSILSGSIAAGGDISAEENKNAFAAGITESSKRNILHSSFMVRTNQLLQQYTKTANYFYLSGLLIGTELRQLPEEEIERIIIAGDKKLTDNYLLALQLLHINKKMEAIDDAVATIQGQLIIYNRVYEQG